MTLSETLYEVERHRYTFVDGLSDFGGFNDGLFMLTYFIMAPYSYSMFMRSLVEQFPVHKSRPSRVNKHALIQKILLTGEDVLVSSEQADFIS